MPVTQELMRLGGFSVELAPETPLELRAAFDFYQHLVITPTRFTPSVIGDTEMLLNAIYTGIVRNFYDARRRIEGIDLLGWYGDEDGKGAIRETKLAKTAGTFTSWTTDITTPHTQLTAAILSTFAGVTLRWKYNYLCARFALDRVCRHFGAEYGVRPWGVIGLGHPAALWQTDPKVLLTRPSNQNVDALGDISAVATGGVDVDALFLDETVEPWTANLILLAEGKGDTIVTGTAGAASPYLDLFGGTATIKRVISTTEELTAAEAAGAATRYLAKINDIAPELRLNVTPNLVGRTSGGLPLILPGDSIYVYDPTSGFYDVAIEKPFRGQLLHPKKVRVYGMTWPITPGLGVYLRTSNGSYIDLTDHVIFETGPVDLHVGTRFRPFRDDPDADVGPNLPPEAARAAKRVGAQIGDWQTYVPVWSSTGTQPTLGNGTIVGAYRMLDAHTCMVTVRLTIGSTTTLGTGLYRFSLPTNLTTARVICIGGFYDDASAADRYPMSARVSGTLIGSPIAVHAPGGAVTAGWSATAPVAGATGDEIMVAGTIEVNAT